MWSRSGTRFDESPDKRARCLVRDRCVAYPACISVNGSEALVSSQVRRCPRSSLLWSEDGESRCVFTIRSGIVSAIRLSEDGTETVVGILGAGQSVGLTRLFAAQLFPPLLARAETGVELCCFSADDLERLVRSDPGAAERVIRALVELLRLVVEQIELRDGLRARDRIRVVLRRLAGYLGDGLDETDLPLTHDELAALAGVNRVTVTRALAVLEREGCVARGQRSIRVRRSGGQVHEPERGHRRRPPGDEGRSGNISPAPDCPAVRPARDGGEK